MKNLFILVGLALEGLAIACSCNREMQSPEVIDREKFEAIYVELLDSAATSQPATSDSTLSPTAERILKRHNVDILRFRATVQAYNSDTKKWKEFYEDVVNRFEERKQKVEE